MLSPQSEHTKSSNSIVMAPQSTLESQRPPPSSDEDFFSSASLASPTSSEENRHSPTSSAAVQPPSRPQIPISWPSDGVLTLAWVMELMLAFEWGSTAVPPSEFPSLLPVEVFDRLILSASKILHKEPNCVKIEDGLSSTSKVVVVGDVHGQLHDVLYLLREAGYPAEDRFFVFNGDYVDRGAWGLETFLLLLAWKNLLWSHFLDWEDNDVERSDTLLDVPADDLSSLFGKVLLPHRVFLLRGNHESKYCTSVYGFEKEVLLKYGDKGKHAYRKCLGCFEGLPLASIIAGRVYTAHGGLFRSIPPTPKRSKGKKTRKVILNTDSDSLSLGSLDELAKARRSVLDPPWEGQNLIPGDVLWSDPSLKPGLSPNKERGIGLLWGPDCTEDFLKKFSLKLIIRSHEGPDAREKRPGLGEMGEGYTIDHAVESGNLITVFSAPDYPQFQATELRYRNKGAYIVLGPPDFDTPSFHSFEAVLPRPQVKPYYDYEDCIDSDEELDMASMIEIE